MYKVIIVDDEFIERRGIQFLLEQYGDLFEITVSDNAEEVINHLKREAYNILFTDIKMPIMDGLELSKEAIQLQPDLNIVILSAYGEFAYAKQAINIGVSEYVLKPINIDEFNKVVKKITEKLEETNSQAKYERDYCLLNLLNGVSIDKLLIKKKRNIDLDFFNQYTRMLLIETGSNFFETSDEAFAHRLKNCIKQDFDYLNINQYQSILFFQNYHSNDKEFEQLGEKIYEEVMKNEIPSANIVLSRELRSYTEFYPEYASFEELLETRFFLGNIHVISHNSIQDFKPESITELINNINYYALKKDCYSLRQCVLHFCRQYRYRQGFSRIYINYIFSEILKAINSNLSGDQEMEFNNQIRKIYSCNNSTEIIDIMEQNIDKLEFRDNDLRNITLINTVINHIQSNYQKDISLEELAGKVYLTPSYLSHIFRKRTGGTIMQFIKQCRMESAKKLLVTTNMKIIDISERIGYTNCSYFCHIFSVYFGMSPEKFRQINSKEMP
ncbi:MAG: response regulator [Eubacterium sp.]|nr:response regulator [Eubacterium sp.]